MKNNVFRLVTLFILCIPVWGLAQDILPCGSSQAREALLKKHPEIILDEERLEQYTQEFVANYKLTNASRSAPIIIPLVFHILHQGGVEDITDAQILDQVRILNRDYNKENDDTSDIVTSFKSIAADIGIEFRLANVDPNGNCTNGIDRIYSVQTYVGDDYSKLNTWPRQNYLNIWVVSHLNGNLAGYAYFPGSVATVYATPAMDGVIILENYIGSIGTSNSTTSRALTHEVGHTLNLEHPWGLTNTPGVACGTCGVADIPETRGSDLMCDLGLDYCNPPIIENVQNYMDYSYCSVMFTEGQKERMLAALSSDISQRSTLSSSSNATAVGAAYGIADPTPNVGTYDSNYAAPTACSPRAAFTVNTRFVCAGGYVSFSDASTNGTVDNYLWEFPGGTPSTSTEKNPRIQFNTTGWQTVTLTVANQLGSNSLTDTLRVYAGDASTYYEAPYFESFEDASTFATEWASINDDENNTLFQQANYTGHTGTNSIMLNNYFTTANHDIDELVSPGFDLTHLTTGQMNLSFYYSLSTWNTDPATMLDSLVVYASANCGSSWTPIYKKGGSSLVLGYYQGFWSPGLDDASDWAQVSVTIPSAFKQSNVRFKFQVFSSVEGNNFFIDDVNIGNATYTGLEALNDIQSVSLFPNPSTGQSLLNFELQRSCTVSVKVYDVTGKEVMDAYEGSMDEGGNRVILNANTILPQGVYIIGIRAGESILQKKMVVQ